MEREATQIAFLVGLTQFDDETIVDEVVVAVGEFVVEDDFECSVRKFRKSCSNKLVFFFAEGEGGEGISVCEVFEEFLCVFIFFHIEHPVVGVVDFGGEGFL